MERFDFKPHGDIAPTYDWGTNEIKFETGNIQYQQKYVEAEETFSMSFSGLYGEWQQIIAFFNARKAQREPFIMNILGEEKTVRFATSKLAPKIKRELGVPKAYEVDIQFRKVPT